MRNGQKFYEEDIIYDHERGADGPRREEELQVVRRRSESARPSRNDDERRDSGRQLRRDMWTEITKDLVIREAIEKMGYGFEETENHFYVIEYLQYVSHLFSGPCLFSVHTADACLGRCLASGGNVGGYSAGTPRKTPRDPVGA